jgi:hypothetical protein
MVRLRRRLSKKSEFDIDILARSRGRQGLVLLREAEKSGKAFLTAGEFETRIGTATTHAKLLRAYLAHWALVTVEEGSERGRLFTRIRLTPKGREVADLFIAARKLTHGDTPLRQQDRERA